MFSLWMWNLCLYTDIPNGDGLLALRHFLNKRPVLQPPTRTLTRLAEPFLAFNTFSFNGNFYRQTGGVAMGSRLGPNYSCLFRGHIEEKFSISTREQNQPCTNDISTTGATSGSREKMRHFAIYVNGFHPSLNFTWVISDVHLPFLNLCVKPASDCLLTSIHYKETDTHSYLNYTSSHPASCKNSIPYNHFLCLGCRVRTGPGKPGKSWNFIMAFSRTGKSWKNGTGPGKFWKSVKLN